MKRQGLKITLLFTLFLTTFASAASAQFYLRPRAGAYIPIDSGDVAYTLGISAGYRWFKPFSTELTYSRVIGTGSTPDGDIFRGDAIYAFNVPYVTPYLTAGLGYLHTSLPGDDLHNMMIPFRVGASVGPLLFLSLNVGFSYAVVLDSQDFAEPYVGIGLSF